MLLIYTPVPKGKWNSPRNGLQCVVVQKWYSSIDIAFSWSRRSIDVPHQSEWFVATICSMGELFTWIYYLSKIKMYQLLDGACILGWSRIWLRLVVYWLKRWNMYISWIMKGATLPPFCIFYFYMSTLKYETRTKFGILLNYVSGPWDQDVYTWTPTKRDFRLVIRTVLHAT